MSARVCEHSSGPVGIHFGAELRGARAFGVGAYRVLQYDVLLSH
jgi:hypothetical protein